MFFLVRLLLLSLLPASLASSSPCLIWPLSSSSMFALLWGRSACSWRGGRGEGGERQQLGAEPAPAARRSARVFASLGAATLRDSLKRVMLVLDFSTVSNDQPIKSRQNKQLGQQNVTSRGITAKWATKTAESLPSGQVKSSDIDSSRCGVWVGNEK